MNGVPHLHIAVNTKVCRVGSDQDSKPHLRVLVDAMARRTRHVKGKVEAINTY